jgi:hypothetical protein
MNDANDKGERKVKSLRDLPQEIQPPRDLWAGIEARLAAERESGEKGATVNERANVVAIDTRAQPARARNGFSARSMHMRWLALAATLAALAVGIWIGRFTTSSGPELTHTGNNTTHAPVAPAAGGSAGAQALQAAYLSDPKFRQERAALVKSLEAKLASLPPDTRAKVLSSLATIHKSMQDLEAALGKDPTNALLQELLVNTYQDEMRVLTTVHEASDAGKGI